MTGATSGYGLHLATILYQHGGKVYLAARNASRAQGVIDDIMTRYPESKGQIAYLHLDLGDLSTIKKSAEEFLAKESKLHVLWNNAGVMIPPQGSTTAQGYELQLGTNVVGPFLFTKLLYPALARAAADSPPGSVRVVWLSSSAVRMAPNPAIDFSNMDYHKDEGAWTKYARSKAANVLLAVEFSRRSEKDGVGSIVGLLSNIVPWSLADSMIDSRSRYCNDRLTENNALLATSCRCKFNPLASNITANAPIETSCTATGSGRLYRAVCRPSA